MMQMVVYTHRWSRFASGCGRAEYANTHKYTMESVSYSNYLFFGLNLNICFDLDILMSKKFIASRVHLTRQCLAVY